MSVSLERLRALKREAGAAAPSLCEARGGLGRGALDSDLAPFESTHPLSVELRSNVKIKSTPPQSSPVLRTREEAGTPTSQSIDALRRLLGLREKVVAPPRPRTSMDRDLPGEEISPGLRLIETFLPMPAPTFDLSLAFAKRDGESVNPRNLLFFDTETTGLAGGTGTRAFMIGAADWHGDGLRVRQLLITTLGAEAAMLDAFTGWLREDTVLSSYNGRCYDSPLLKTRYRLARKDDPITPLDHVDLLFPTRRRYRGVWENCRLATIERELLRIVREDDLPGSEAPAAWLNYLRGGSARNLRRVAAHNHQDVVTLSLLMTRLAEVEAMGEETVPFIEAP
ncbi:MAG: ribonuclease H-like domain-containing protein [Pseudoxanthomonas sp.]